MTFPCLTPTYDYRDDGRDYLERDAYLHEEHADDCQCFPCNYESEVEE